MAIYGLKIKCVCDLVRMYVVGKKRRLSYVGGDKYIKMDGGYKADKRRLNIICYSTKFVSSFNM